MKVNTDALLLKASRLFKGLVEQQVQYMSVFGKRTEDLPNCNTLLILQIQAIPEGTTTLIV